MLFQDALIHDHEDAGLASLLRGRFVHYPFLHPDRWNLQTNGLIDHLFHKLRPPVLPGARSALTALVSERGRFSARLLDTPLEL